MTNDTLKLKAGVVGWPISHSKSPLLHGHWLKRYGINGSYEALAIEPEYFERDIRALQASGFRGCNVTLPHKEAAFALADHHDAAATAMGAANTLVFREDGKIHASNTDGLGFMANLRAGAPHWQPAQGPALVLGAGGAARGIVFALLEAGVPEVRISNRTAAKAEQLAAIFDGAKSSDSLEDVNLLVNTTSLGMVGHPPLMVDLAPLPGSATVADIVYTPLETDLLKAAKARGLIAVEGLGMLLHQAVPGFEAWFGVVPKVDAELRAAVLAG